MKDKVVIVTSRSGFPNGYGAASIIRKYAKGFSDNGYKVHIMLLRPSDYEGKQINFELKGRYEKATFEYMGRKILSPISKVKRLVTYGYGLLRCCWYLTKNKKHIHTLFFYSPDYICSVRTITTLCSILKIRCVGIKTESSFCDSERVKKKNWLKIERVIYQGFEELYVISRYLEKQIRGFGYAKKITVLPILIDTSMYESQSECDRRKEIVYMGTMGHKEETNALIEVAKHIFKKHCDWKLVIIGDASRIEDKITSYVGNGIVECTGVLSYNQLPDRLVHAGILILPRSKQEYSNAGFPIKLGEYLLTGAPVIATDVGEIKDYLKEDKEIYLVDSDNIDCFLDKINFVIEHYEEALEVGAKGYDAATRLFDAKIVCKRMLK